MALVLTLYPKKNEIVLDLRDGREIRISLAKFSEWNGRVTAAVVRIEAPQTVRIRRENRARRASMAKSKVLDRGLVVGVNSDFRRAKDDGPGYTVLSEAYYNALVKAGACPIIIPPLADTLDQVLVMLDGVVLVGSRDDLDPRYDGFELHPTTRPMAPERERFDRALCRRLDELRLPVLAIGAGMQLLNVVCGGTLAYDIASEWPKALPHADALDPQHRHVIKWEPGSLVDSSYHGATGVEENQWTAVTSQHHVAVDGVAPGFSRTAWCPDGVTEAIESADPAWLAVGVQWHPESEHATKIEAMLIGRWVAEVVARSRPGWAPVHRPAETKPQPKSTAPPKETISREALAKLAGIKVSTLAIYDSEGKGPQPRIKVGRTILYGLEGPEGAQSWLAARRSA